MELRSLEVEGFGEDISPHLVGRAIFKGEVPSVVKVANI
jgi:hypothetical protein